LPHSARLLSPLLLGTVIAGSPRRDRYGLTVIPLQIHGADPARRRDVLPPIVRELQPPTPGAVVIANTAGRAGPAVFGQRLTGGMADRVVATTTAAPPGGASVTPVTPLEPRWWNEGPLRLGGRLPPTVLALLLLAASDWIGLRSLARTALWEACRELPEDGRAEAEDGWAILDGSTLLAAHLILPGAMSSPAPAPALKTHSSTLVHRALTDAARDDRVVWSTTSRRDLVELSILRPSLALPEAVLRPSAGR
jgi:hypothetical protein